MITFEAELSVNSLKQLSKKLEQYGKDLENSTIHINEALADEMYDVALQNTPVVTGELKGSINKEFNKDYARVYTDKEYAKYVEFGTGVRGKDTHPRAKEANWEYDYNQTGYKGFTARKFMYNTYLDMDARKLEIARKVLKERGLL